MFPANDGLWIPYIFTAEPRNESPCWVDIVGNMANPAAFFYLDPPPSPTPSSVAFRMRLNGDPLSNNPNLYALKEFVWGVQITSATNTPIFTVRVNASGANYLLQVIDEQAPPPGITFSATINLTSPENPLTNNVRVRSAGTIFPCPNPNTPDPDFYLDFTVPTSAFPGFNFTTSTYRMCYFTSTQDNVINKEYVCGDILNPPVGVPVLQVSKSIVSGPTTLCTIQPANWVLRITLTNVGTVDVTDIVVTDTINGSLASPTAIAAASLGTAVVALPLITWTISTLPVGQSATLLIQLSGFFTAAGHYVLNSGQVEAEEMDPINFADSGVLVFARDQLDIVKTIVSGPVRIDLCEISTWTVRIAVANTGDSDLADVVLIDTFSPFLVLEAPPVFNPSLGTVFFAGNEVIWTIDVLPGKTIATLDITLMGFFTELGVHPIDTVTTDQRCNGEVAVSDPGVTVTDGSAQDKVDVKICAFECECGPCGKDDEKGPLLEGVTLRLYNGTCKLINTISFDKCVVLTLAQGNYVAELTKEGYNRKFLTLLLGSGDEIFADVCLIKKAVKPPCAVPEKKVDIYDGLILDKFDVDVIFSESLCLPSRAKVECVCDVVDSFSHSITCNSKLGIHLDIEKNVVYKLDRVKQLVYRVYQERFCLPIRRICDESRVEHKVYVEKVSFCLERTRLSNIALIKLNVYVIDSTDLYIHTDQIPSCD